MFRKFRILILLLILLGVSVQTWLIDARIGSWESTVSVGIYPIAFDDSPETARFIDELDVESFADIESWFQDEFKHYGINLQIPVRIVLGPRVMARPPALPQGKPGIFDAIVWSLKLRWWASRHDDLGKSRSVPQVRLFVLFHPARDGEVLPHSIGLDKGKIGVIHVFASERQKRQNAVIIAHELLHTFKATDKYDPITLQPIHPHGYAQPDRQPLLPQRAAEIMGGRIPISLTESRIPAGLSEAIIGPATALEIGLKSGDQ
ncbi:MAG: hypothetical protein LBB76_02100 [Azoarcus sp.]|jgi:hypothetical protein|nr:hypothetical protein [Azoarcus sp.]